MRDSLEAAMVRLFRSRAWASRGDPLRSSPLQGEDAPNRRPGEGVHILPLQGGGKEGVTSRMARLWLPAVLALALSAPASAQSLRSLRADVAALGDRVERLEAVSEIEAMQRAYGYYVDKSQFRETADVFAEDGILEIGGRGRFLGRDRAFEYLELAFNGDGMKQGDLQDHQQFQGIVTIAPDGEHAYGRWTAIVMAGGATIPCLWGDVTYENTYKKVDGVWQVDHLRAPFNMYAQCADGWVRGTTPNSRPDSFPPPPDLPPSAYYLTFPNYYNAPFHYPNPVTGEVADTPSPAAGGVALGRGPAFGPEDGE